MQTDHDTDQRLPATTRISTTPARHWRRQRWIRPTLLMLLVITGGLTGTGLLYQAVAEARDQRLFPAPGQLVDVGGYRLHLQVMGEDTGRPTVILEHGSSSMSAQWGWVQPEIARFTRVVAYDRPGQGWSEPAPTQLDAVGLAEDLHAALEQRGVSGPYVLVGHSMGSLPARAFAERYAHEVVGIVLIDPRHLGLSDDFPQLPPINPAARPLTLRLAPVVAQLGLIRLLDPIAYYVDQLPARQAGQARALLASSSTWRGLWSDVVAAESAVPLLRDGEQLSDKPLLIVSAGEPDTMDFPAADRAAFTALHARMADTLSNHGRLQIVAGADHLSIVTDQQHATAVVAAVRDVVDAAQQASRLTDSQ